MGYDYYCISLMNTVQNIYLFILVRRPCVLQWITWVFFSSALIRNEKKLERGCTGTDFFFFSFLNWILEDLLFLYFGSGSGVLILLDFIW